MPLIPEPLLDDIQSRTDLAEVIGRYLPLKRAGRHFKALCPFHKERTPSFHINTEKQIYHCFGCGAGGNIFSFLMQQERLTFPEAVRQLAQQVGVVIPIRQDAGRNGKLDKLFEILEKTCHYYQRVLAHPQTGRMARAYLKRRGVTDATLKAFRLGCAPDGWDGLIRAAAQSRIPLELLEEAGVILKGARGPIDRFRQRLIFPIHDVRGRVVGFGGRSLAGQEPKYLNSPETSVYSKGKHLFGLAQAKEAVVKAKAAIVVEGYFDCVVLWQCGLTHVVSPLGTAFTPEQARLLSRYTDSVILAFDADAAGEAASLRGIDVLMEAGFHVRVAQLPVGIDPDELVQSYGTTAFEQVLEKSLGLMEFLLACAKKRYAIHDAEEKVRAAQFILPTIAKVPNAMLRVEYLRVLADRLGLDERAVAEELEKVQPRRLEDAPGSGRRHSVQGAERLLTALILDHPARWDAARREQVADQISDGRLRHILAMVSELQAAGHTPTPAQLISRLADAEASSLVSELVQSAQSVPHPDDAFRECLGRVRADAQKRKLSQLREQIRTAQQFGHEDEVARLLTTYQRLVKPHEAATYGAKRPPQNMAGPRSKLAET